MLIYTNLYMHTYIMCMCVHCTIRIRVYICMRFNLLVIHLVNFFEQYLADRISMYMHAYTLYSAVRPFGCSLLISGFDSDGPQMYMVDPSGVSHVSI